MNKVKRIIITSMCIIAIAASWLIVLSSKTTAEKQLDLIHKAELLTDDEIYILAVPLLEEAAGYDAKHTAAAEEELKKVYIALIDKRGISRKYTGLLEKQMARRGAPPEVFEEAAEYYLGINARQDALAVLKAGIESTSSAGLEAMYERERYAYEINRNTFEAVTSIYNRTLQVQQDGKWGIVNADGSTLIPCRYDKISTFSDNRAIVKKDDVIYAVDKDDNRVAVTQDGTQDFRNFSENRTALLSDEGWRRATGDFELGSNVFDDIGMHSGGYAAAGSGGKWGVISIGGQWLVEPQYDEIIQDELGRCYGQDAVFVRSGQEVYLYANGAFAEEVYQDARPFSDNGFAAVKKNGKWGFIDTEGNMMIEFAYDDALSFGGHLAAVKQGELWGYVSVRGDIVIEPAFLEAKSFDDGSAPVLTEKGWQIITLVEYKKERVL